MTHNYSLFRAAGLVLAANLAASASAADISVTLLPLQPTISRGDDVLVGVTLTNTSNTAQQLLRWRTPLDDSDAPLFEVRRDGAPVPYLGRHAKRAAPGPRDYVTLEPGATLQRTVELSALYEMSITGAYTIRYHILAAPTVVAAKGQQGLDELISNQVSVWINGRLPRGSKAATAMAEVGGAGLTFNGCSNAQQEQLGSAMDAGRAMALDSHAYLNAGKEYGARYLTWFGGLDAARGARVSSNVAAIKDAFENKPVKIDCGCNEDYFAYVYPAKPYTVWVCKAFWAAKVTGTDSRGGTLLHEMSHFDVVAGTDDHVYGQQGAGELARSAPQRAINNADSYEYFGENSPPQQ